MKSGRNWGRLGMIYKSINEIADVTKLAGFEFTKHIKYIENGEIIALRALNLRDGHLDLKDIKRIDKSVSEQLTRSKLYKNDIVISYTGTIGECAQIHENDKYHLAPNVAKIAPNPIFVNPQYLFHYIRSSMFRNQMYNYCHGSTQPTIPMKTIRELSIPIFPLETQKQIASILSALDDKIELNNRINENLEQQAQAIFKSWFVDFEPFGGVMPEDWRTGSLSEICGYSKDKVNIEDLTLDTYYSTENMQPNRQGAVQATALPTIKQTIACKKGDVLISNIRPYFKKIIYCFADCGCSTDVLCFVPNKSEYSAFLYCALYSDKFFDYMVAGSKGTKMPRGDKQQIMMYPICIPSTEYVEQFSKIVAPMLETVYTNRLEANDLAILRDTLLPKLMNGEIDVSEVKI